MIKINDTAALIAAGLSTSRFHIALGIVQLISPATEELELVNNYPMKDGSFMVSMLVDDAVADRFFFVFEKVWVSFGVYFNSGVPGKCTLMLSYNEMLPAEDRAFGVLLSFEPRPINDQLNKAIAFDEVSNAKLTSLGTKHQANAKKQVAAESDAQAKTIEDAKRELAIARANAKWGVTQFVEDHPVATTVGVVAVVAAVGYGIWQWNNRG